MNQPIVRRSIGELHGQVVEAVHSGTGLLRDLSDTVASYLWDEGCAREFEVNQQY